MKYFVIFLSFLAGGVIFLVISLNYFPDIYVVEKIVTEGEYKYFRIGMNKTEALEIIENKYSHKNGFFIYVSPNLSSKDIYISINNKEKINLIKSDTWVLGESWGKMITIKFVNNKLFSVEYYHNYFAE